MNRIRSQTITSEMKWLIFLITSYFFCLPLGRYSIGPWASDFRLFDFAILSFFIFNYTFLSRRYSLIYRKSEYFVRYGVIMLLVVYISILFAVVYSGFQYILPTAIRLFRFTGYILTGVAVVAIVDSRSKYKMLFYIIFGNMVIQAGVAFMQGIGIFPQFWPQYWLEMYDNQLAPVATLSPHHKHMGIVMLVGISLAVALFRIHNSWFSKVVFLLIMLVMFSIPLFAGTRTYLLGLAGFVPAYFYINRTGAIPSVLAIGVLVFLILKSSFSDRIVEPISEKFDERVSGRIEKFEGYQGLYFERMYVYTSVLSSFLENPYILVTGAGFQNGRFFIRGTGAHNNYLHVLLEIGIIGFIIFIILLFKLHKNLLYVFKYFPGKFEKMVAAHVWVSLIAILLTMFVGETFWAQAAMFTLAGQLMAIWALAITPLFWQKLYLKINQQSDTHYTWFR